MTKMPGEYKYRGKIWATSATIGVMGIAYLGLFGMTISNISEYQKTEKRIASLTADISTMEFTYMAKESEINASFAASLGFVEPANIVIARQSASLSAVALSNVAK